MKTSYIRTGFSRLVYLDDGSETPILVGRLWGFKHSYAGESIESPASFVRAIKEGKALGGRIQSSRLNASIDVPFGRIATLADRQMAKEWNHAIQDNNRLHSFVMKHYKLLHPSDIFTAIIENGGPVEIDGYNKNSAYAVAPTFIVTASIETIIIKPEVHELFFDMNEFEVKTEETELYLAPWVDFDTDAPTNDTSRGLHQSTSSL